MKKIKKYQKLLWSTSRSNSTDLGIMMVAYLFTMIVCTEFYVFRDSFVFILYNLMFLYCIRILSNNRSLELRAIPVSDSFALKNMLFILPIVAGIIVSVILVTLVCCYCIIALIMNTTSLAMIKAALPNASQLLIGGIYGFAFIIGIFGLPWFAGATFFLRAQKKYSIIGYATVIILLLIENLGIKFILSTIGGRKKVYIYYLLESLPMAWVILVVLWIIVIGLAIMDWKFGLKIYRKYNNLGIINNNNRQTTIVSKKATTVIVIVGIGVCATIIILIVLISSSFDERLKFKSDQISQYNDWNTWKDKSEMDADFWCRMNRVIFPKEVDENTVNAYYAEAEGEYSSNGYGCSYYRYLSVSLNEKAFNAEKTRLANLSVNYKGDTQYLLHDTEHFDDEAYIAVYDVQGSVFEYAVLDYTSYTIKYLFIDGLELNQTPAGTECLPTNNAFNLVPDKEINYENDAFSVYYLLDENEEINQM